MPSSPQNSQVYLDHTTIIKAVLDMLARTRFKNLIFQEISAVIGCSHQDLCYHFPSKIHLLQGLIDFFCHNHRQYLTDTMVIDASENYSEQDKLFEIFFSFTEVHAPYRKIIAELATDIITSPDYGVGLVPDLIARLRQMLVDQGVYLTAGFKENLKFHFLCLIACRFFYLWCQQRVDNQNELMIDLDRLLNFWIKYSSYLE